MIALPVILDSNQKVKIGNGQEKVQSESKSHPKNPSWEKNKLKL